MEVSTDVLEQLLAEIRSGQRDLGDKVQASAIGMAEIKGTLQALVSRMDSWAERVERLETSHDMKTRDLELRITKVELAQAASSVKTEGHGRIGMEVLKVALSIIGSSIVAAILIYSK